MLEPMNRMEEPKKRGRKKRVLPVAEVTETRVVPSMIRCARCGHESAPRVRKTNGNGERVCWCEGCGEWMRLPE